MGFVAAPLAFAICIVGLLLAVANATVGDVIGYGSVLFMKTDSGSYQVEDFMSETMPSVDEEKDVVYLSDITFPTYNTVYGQIIIPSAEIDCPLVYGDSNEALQKGAGQYMGSRILGYGGTTLIGGHVSRHFATLPRVQVGDMIEIRTTYGVYTYQVRHTGIHSAKDESVYDLSREDENLVLYTCHYQNVALGSVNGRYFVCADYVSGPMLVSKEETP